MPTYTDQTGRDIDIPAVPRRIISLVPSQTEFLFDLGLEEEVIGITKFCVHPTSWFQQKTRIGGTKDLHIEQILALQPDLVIANKEENNRGQIALLAETLPVWVSAIGNLDEALQMMRTIGQITGKSTSAEKICTDIGKTFTELALHPPGKPFATAYLIWQNPYMTVGGDTFIHDMLGWCGLANIFGSSARYPQTTVQELAAAGVELILLSSEPYPFKKADLDALQTQLPNTRILLVDGEYFSWYGSRLLGAPEYFNEIMEKFGNNLAWH